MKGALPDPSYAAAALARAGDDAALDDLARVWLPHVYAWCHRLGGPGLDAEDAAHESLIVMCRRIHRVTSAEVFPTWLFGVCRRVLANHRRRAWLRRWVPGSLLEFAWSGPGPDTIAESARTADAVWKVLEELPAAQREVLVLCELEERTGTEAAALLGIPVGTVKSRLRAAQRSFRAAMGEPALAPEGT